MESISQVSIGYLINLQTKEVNTPKHHKLVHAYFLISIHFEPSCTMGSDVVILGGTL